MLSRLDSLPEQEFGLDFHALYLDLAPFGNNLVQLIKKTNWIMYNFLYHERKRCI